MSNKNRKEAFKKKAKSRGMRKSKALGERKKEFSHTHPGVIELMNKYYSSNAVVKRVRDRFDKTGTLARCDLYDLGLTTAPYPGNEEVQKLLRSI